MIDALEKLLAKGTDNPTLRFGLGSAYLGDGKPLQAIVHLQACVRQSPDYSAGWKLLGKACCEAGQNDAAIQAYQTGLNVAAKQGDKQAEKEMGVFLKRLQRQNPPSSP